MKACGVFINGSKPATNISRSKRQVQSLKSVMTSMLSPAVLGNAAIISAPGRIEVKTLEFREPEAGELRVQIEGCGVCASNLPVWEGKPWFDYPFEPGAPGHEAWGRLDAIGEGVTGFKRGDRVALLSSHAYAEFDFARTSEVVHLMCARSQTPHTHATTTAP